MTATVSHFKVGCGDMTLFRFDDGRTLLVDINIRPAAVDPEDETPNVIDQLRERLDTDGDGRVYVDAFLLTHPDKDHILGLVEHFHLGPPSDWSERTDKILIREMWSSPIVFRRASRNHPLCDDACAWSTEARRRVRLFEEQGIGGHGDKVIILGEDIDGKTDDLEEILVKAGESFSVIAGQTGAFQADLLAPMLADTDEEAEELSKNNSSVILSMAITGDHVPSAARYLIGGDAEVAIWERMRKEYADQDLAYDILIAPHHCSWHSLSHDSWSDLGEDVEVSEDARSALGQANAQARIIASCKTITDDDSDPPCVRAEREYREILSERGGTFTCVADQPGDGPYEIEITAGGHRPKRVRLAATAAAVTGLGTQPFAHG
ncbi:metallohydrolase [Methylobacterium sp. J-076]|uniref:metallohydrolase n=1 Tax=Methylobacterium sp. J-076 TaxID=2836655 RepID=UPI001FB91C85|nr:metallohydrolase [Methylobacterium sp. J-076]MCJ2014184.1 metallohydrolase [Methylobacterium sp. J-076]